MSRDAVTISLFEPVQAHGEKIEELILRPPTGKDILASGYPYSMERNPRTGAITEVVHFPSARLLLSTMAQVPASTIDMLQAVDIMGAMEVLKAFFFYAPQRRSSQTSSPGGAGLET